jgi:hypothetical protein
VLSLLVMALLYGLISPGMFYYTFSPSLGLNICRNHYNEYLECCNAKNVEAKARPPKDWKEPKKYRINVFLCRQSLTQFFFLSSQQTIDGFTVIKKKPPPPVTKAGMTEYILELIVDGDLVSNSFIPGSLDLTLNCCSHFDSLSGHRFVAYCVIPTQNSLKRMFQRKCVLRLQLTRR